MAEAYATGTRRRIAAHRWSGVPRSRSRGVAFFERELRAEVTAVLFLDRSGLVVVTALLLLGACAGAPTAGSTVPTAPSGPTAPVAIELRPVSSVVAPGQAEYETLVDRLGEDVFYGDVNGDVSFTPGVDLLYVLGAPFVGTGDFASAAVVPPPSGDRDPWQVSFTLTTDAGERLSVATTEAVGGKIAIVEGDRVLSAPTVQEPVTSGNGVVPAVSLQEAERIVRLMLGS
jgi:hypothetical protein